MLTDMVVRQAKASGKPYTLADFDGLFLYVSPVGGKARHFRYTWVGQRARIFRLAAIPNSLCARRANFVTRPVPSSPRASTHAPTESKNARLSGWLKKTPSWRSMKSGWNTGN